jgi:hypothetical protein
VFDGMWWKDRRLKAGEDGPATEREKLSYEKPYDHYFCEPDELWELKYALRASFFASLRFLPPPNGVC